MGNDKTKNQTGQTQAKKKGGMGIRGQMLIKLLPTVIIATIVLTVVSAINSKNTINNEIQNTMKSELQSNSNEINADLEIVRSQAINLAREVSIYYKSTPMDVFKTSFSDAIKSSKIINGAGIWFEPNAYNAEKYMGPYWYKDGDNIVETWEYSNAEYDYFSQEYYTNAAKMKEGTAEITDPYYDESSKSVMATCSAPIYSNGQYIGCVTCDISLDTMVEIVSSIKVGENGTAMLLASDGTYIYTDDNEKVQKGVNIKDDENASLAKAGEDVLANESGLTEYKGDSETYNLYYATIPGVNWKLMIKMPVSEINAPVQKLTIILIIVAAIAVIVCAVVIILIANSLSKTLNRVKAFAGDLAKGDFTVDPETKAQAQADIAEGGYWSVEETSKRILDFATAITGGDPSKLENMRDAFLKGYKQAEETWGGKLPEISQKTYDAVLKGFDEKAKEYGLENWKPVSEQA